MATVVYGATDEEKLDPQLSTLLEEGRNTPIYVIVFFKEEKKAIEVKNEMETALEPIENEYNTFKEKSLADERANKLDWENGLLTDAEYEAIEVERKAELDAANDKRWLDRNEVEEKYSDDLRGCFSKYFEAWGIPEDVEFTSVSGSFTSEPFNYAISLPLTTDQIKMMAKDDAVSSMIYHYEIDCNLTETVAPPFGDINGDYAIDAIDASFFLQYAADVGAQTFTGTFEDYMNRTAK